MEPSELLRKIATDLERLGISYFVTGSIATIAYGEPRLTNDIDVVIELRLDQVEALCAAFPAPEFYCSKEAAIQASRQRFQFNILHPASGLKIDLIVADTSEFNRARFQRRLRMPGGTDFDIWLSSPEDIILKKMEFYQLGQSEKHIRDILGVLKLRAENLDRAYIAQWADRLHVADIWNAILERACKT